MQVKNRTIFLLILAAASLSFVLKNYMRPILGGETEAIAAEFKLPEVRYPAPNFSLLDLEGKKVRLYDYRDSVVLMGFWTTW